MSFLGSCLSESLQALLFNSTGSTSGPLTVERAQQVHAERIDDHPDRPSYYADQEEHDAPPPSYRSAVTTATTTTRAPHRCPCACAPTNDDGDRVWPDVLQQEQPVVVDVPEMEPKLANLLQQLSTSIEQEIGILSSDLRQLSLTMWHHPELQWQEHKTHDLFVSYFESHLASQGWITTPHAYGIPTAFETKFEFYPPGFQGNEDQVRCIGFQSELDALPGIGHGCGHNLIAISGVAAAVSLARAAQTHNVPIKVVLLGTPAEEGGGGKINLIRAGAYDQMQVCLMVHPAILNTVTPMLAVQSLSVHYHGKTAHAAAAPWQGINAQDAAVLAYNNVSAMRQQLPPTARVHGIIQGHNMAPNVVPDNVSLHYNVRGPTAQDVEANLRKVIPCFEAAALATGCTYKIEKLPMYYDVWQCPGLKQSFESTMTKRYRTQFVQTPFTASTDFGNVTYTLPAIHPAYAINVGDHPFDKGNHTIGFTNAAKTEEAHQRTMEVCAGLATTGAKVLIDTDFYQWVYKQWEGEMSHRGTVSSAVARGTIN